MSWVKNRAPFPLHGGLWNAGCQWIVWKRFLGVRQRKVSERIPPACVCAILVVEEFRDPSGSVFFGDDATVLVHGSSQDTAEWIGHRDDNAVLVVFLHP